MSEAVKRFVVDIQGREARECVFAADHDRIVSSLTEAGRKMQAERDRLAERCRELEECLGDEQRTRHQAELDGIALRAEVERLQGLLKEARYPVAHYLSDREEASDRAPTKSMRYEAGQSMLKVHRLLINIDAALEASR